MSKQIKRFSLEQAAQAEEQLQKLSTHPALLKYAADRLLRQGGARTLDMTVQRDREVVITLDWKD